jgi:predicted Holliday junction resolvase-like endonuclease
MKGAISLETLIIIAIILIIALIIVKLVTNITTSTKEKIEKAGEDLNKKLENLCKEGDLNCSKLYNAYDNYRI